MTDATDHLAPALIAWQAEHDGIARANLGAFTTLGRAILAGAYFGLAMVLVTIVASFGDMPFGVTRLLQGVVFVAGVIPIIVAKAELFATPETIVACLSGQAPAGKVLAHEAIVYVGNALGAVVVAVAAFGGIQGRPLAAWAVLTAAADKGSLGFVQAIALGVVCNSLICLAFWLCYDAQSAAGKALAALFPVAAAVAIGFEHSIANLFTFAFAFLAQVFGTGGAAGAVSVHMPASSWPHFLLSNLAPVTLGNLLGASLVGLAFWLTYCRRWKR